jgi:hypothetical protein
MTRLKEALAKVSELEVTKETLEEKLKELKTKFGNL